MKTDKKNAVSAPTENRIANQTKSIDSTSANPLLEWFSLAADVKPSRTDRTVKKSWKRGRK